jgi:hypothetical protein
MLGGHPAAGSDFFAKVLRLVVVCGRWGFLSLRDPTTRWSGHPRVSVFSGKSDMVLRGIPKVGWDRSVWMTEPPFLSLTDLLIFETVLTDSATEPYDGLPVRRETFANSTD